MSKADIHDERGRSAADVRSVIESLLKSEISFWQELIRHPSSTMTEESMERMNQALALAQTKLRKYALPQDTGIRELAPQSTNVYPINGRKA